MEVVETCQKLDYKRQWERRTYKFIWKLAFGDQGENSLSDYSKDTLIPSGPMTCKTGFFHGPRKYFEFFASPDQSLSSTEIYLKMVYPTGTVSVKSASGTTGTVDEFEIFSATFSPTMSDKKRYSYASGTSEFSLTSSPVHTPNTNTKDLDCKTIWMSTYFLGNRETQSKLEALNFEITIQHNIGNTKKMNENPASAVAIRNNYDAHSHNFAAQMNTSQFLFSTRVSDFKMYCEGKEYPAHRIILANKSNVFNALFSNQKGENITGKLLIVESTPEVVEEFLRFIYTGSMKSMEEHAPGIFSMAVKYDVKDLKTISENYLIRSVSIVNVLERYTLGKLLSSDAMVKKSVEIMKAKRGEIWKTKEKFFEDCKKFPELFSIVFP